MKKQHAQIPTALQFFGYRYPPFADTFEIHTSFLGNAENLMLQRTLALTLVEAARRNDKIVTVEVDSAISQESETFFIGKGGFGENNRLNYSRENA